MKSKVESMRDLMEMINTVVETKEAVECCEEKLEEDFNSTPEKESVLRKYLNFSSERRITDFDLERGMKAADPEVRREARSVLKATNPKKFKSLGLTK